LVISGRILTLASLGCHALPIVTAITTQDSAGIEDFLVMEAEWVSDQARFILEDMPVAAFKVGMMGSIENLAVITEIAADYPDIPLVLDPNFLASNENLTEELIQGIRELLLPYAHVVIVNGSAAKLLATGDSDSEEELSLTECVGQILLQNCPYVLITGSQENTPDKVVNTLYDTSGMILGMEWDRLDARFHGAGSTLSAAIAGALGNGLNMIDAVQEAQEYTWQALSNAYRAGMGCQIPDRLFWARKQDSPAS
jgi:hydroxymethylpyrimidine/phosphomethylpyrimidine kinase